MKRTIILWILAGIASVPSCNLRHAVNTESERVEEVAVLHPATSPAKPIGMELVWHDEFDGSALDRTKWSTNYYSTLDYYYKTNWDGFRGDSLPQPAMKFTGSSVILYTSDSLPAHEYWPSGRKVSSVQSYDWLSGKHYTDNSPGGYWEARIRRRAAPDATMVNGALWFDSPGPDMRYYIENGNRAAGAQGVRPAGQVFEIDLCENLNTEIVLHGKVDATGRFRGNIGHYKIPGNYRDKWTTHGMLWTPRGLIFYVDGREVARSWDPNDIRSPNHAMVVFLGMYGRGDAEMEVDYIRRYKWRTDPHGELPNGGFEYADDSIFPWEGDALPGSAHAITGRNSAVIAAGGAICQYVYLDHSRDYKLDFSYRVKRGADLEVRVENLEQVTGACEGDVLLVVPGERKITRKSLLFQTKAEYGNHKRTVRITFTAPPEAEVWLDDVSVNKITSEGGC